MDSRPNQAFNLLLTCVAILWLACVSLAFVRDLSQVTTANPEADPAYQAAKALTPVNDTSQGWFPAQRDPVFNWDDGVQGWVLEDDDPTALTPTPVAEALPQNERAAGEPKAKQALHVTEAQEPARGKALAVPVHFPDPATIFRDNIVSLDDKFKMQGVRFVAYDVFVPKEACGFIGCLFFMKDKDGLWYQARSRSALLPGRWNTVAADIRGGSPQVTPLGHLGQWDENQASRVRTIGITFYGDRDFQGRLLVDNFRAWLRPQRFTQMLGTLGGSAPVTPERTEYLCTLKAQADSFTEAPIEVLNFRSHPAAAQSAAGQPAGPPEVRRFETLTLRFELNRQLDNPFDPEQADILCVVETPSQQKLEHIAFWYQDYDRADRFVGDELIPLGRAEWRVRITPRQEGVYKYHLRIRLRNSQLARWETLETPVQTFVCAPSAHKGFVRVSKSDARFFEFDNGQFFYPLGHNLHSPVDMRCWEEVFRKQIPQPAGRGLPMYADFFPKMKAAGENTAEVWMCAWWVGIEWTSRWRDYYGAKRYSLQHAWLLDKLLEMARHNDLNIHLVIDNHGKFSAWCDWEWDQNPYNRNCEPNGPVTSAQDFFTDETARKWHRNKLRYIVARWGSDPTILGWELVSEYDLVGGRHRDDTNARQVFHKSAVLKSWAREMIGYLRQCDTYQRPITNHYATDINQVDLDLAQTPLFDYVVTDAYRQDRPYTGIATRSHEWVLKNFHNAGNVKPFWITEFGGDWNATVPAALEADAQCGLWATWMTDAAGTPMFWWYDFVDRANLYPYYRAFANYIQGEDRRGLRGTLQVLPITAATGPGTVQGQVYCAGKLAYGWVYSRAAMEMMPLPADRPQYQNVETQVTDLQPGTYRIEYWDCSAGRIVQSDSQTLAEGGKLSLRFPNFTTNMAFKIKMATDDAKNDQR